jgi:hypothetical protein
MTPSIKIIALLIVLCLANGATADYWRFTLNQYHCVEPREWKTDHVAFRAAWITATQDGQIVQNETTYRSLTSYVDRGDTSDLNVMWQDIMLGQEEANLLMVFIMWNLGDEDPQKVGLGEFCE